MIATLTLNPSVDKSCVVGRVVPERKLRARDVHREPGGGGINVARVVARLGAPSRAVWASGGPIGTLLAQLLDALDLDHVPVRIRDLTRENLIVLEESSGEQYRFGMPGAAMTEEELERSLEALRAVPADWIVASGSLPPGVPDDFYGRVVKLAHDRGAHVIVDTSGAALRKAVEQDVFLLKPNLAELSDLAGREIRSDEEVVQAAREIVNRGSARAVVASMGAAGAHLVTRETALFVRTPTVRIRSKVGAGDSMVAALVTALSRGASMEEAVCWGVAGGAAAVMTPGTELAHREDVESLVRRVQARTLA